MGRIILECDLRLAQQYALNYPENDAKIKALEDSRRAIRYDLDHVQSFNNSDPTFVIAEQIGRLRARNKIIDDALITVYSPFGDEAVKKAKMHLCYGKTISECGRFPMNRNVFYRKRREFWKHIAERI